MRPTKTKEKTPEMQPIMTISIPYTTFEKLGLQQITTQMGFSSTDIEKIELLNDRGETIYDTPESVRIHLPIGSVLI